MLNQYALVAEELPKINNEVGNGLHPKPEQKGQVAARRTDDCGHREPPTLQTVCYLLIRFQSVQNNMNTKSLPLWTRWLFPSIKDILFLSLLLAPNLIPDFSVLGDSDTGWHIRNGDHILATFSFPRVDYFSYTCQGKPWFAWEWLADLILSLIHRAAGLNGIALWGSLTFSMVFMALFLWLIRRGGNLFISTLITLLAALASTIHWHARPHLFTMLFLLSWIIVIEHLQNKGARGAAPPRWSWFFFPLSMLIWTNLHGGFVTGLVMLGIYGLGNFLSGIISSDLALQKQRKTMAGIFLRLAGVSFLMTAINPYGFKIHQHILNSYFHSSYLVDNIAEFISPNFHWSSVKCFEALLVGSILILGISWKRLTFVEVGILIFWTHMALFSARHIPLYTLAVAPILVRHLSHYIRSSATQNAMPGWGRRLLLGFETLSNNFHDFEKQFKGVFYPSLAVLILCVAALNQGDLMGITVQKAGFDPRLFPVKAAQFIETHPQTGRFFTTDQWGGYWIYRFFPRYPVFFDGRSDMYGEEFLKKYQKIVGLSFGWKTVLKEYQVGWILLSVKDPLATVLKENSEWKVIYDDHIAIIFIRTAPYSKP